MIKRLRVSVTEPLLLPSNLKHTGTIYKVSKSIDFSVENLIVNELSTTKLYDNNFNVDIKEDDTLYVVTQYSYNVVDIDGNNVLDENDVPLTKLGTPSRITPVAYNQDGVSISDTIVKTPIVSLEVTNEFEDMGSLILKTSDFDMFSSAGLHKSTSWYIKDVDGKEIYSRVKDEDNLTSILLPKEITLKDKFIAYVVHHSDTNADSNCGLFKNILVNKLPRYKITMFNKLIIGRYLYFGIKLINYGFKNIKVTIKNSDENIVSTLDNIKSTYFRIPTNTFQANEIYSFNFEILSDTDIVIEDVITTYAYEFDSIYDKNKKYLDKYDYRQLLFTNGETNTLSYQLQNGYILYGRNFSKDITLGKLINGILTPLGTGVNLNVSTEITTPSTFVKELLNGDVVVSYVSKDKGTLNKTFLNVYKFNPFNNEFILENSNMLNTTKTLVSPGSIITIDNSVAFIEYTLTGPRLVIFNPYNGLKNIYTLPYIVEYGYSLVTDKNNNIIITAGTNSDISDVSILHERYNDKVFVFNSITEQITELGTDILSEVNKGIYHFHMVRRHDGKITMFNNINNTNLDLLADQSTYILDVDTGEVEVMYNDHEDGLPYGCTIVLNNGDVMRYTNMVNDPQKVYTYIADSLSIDELDDNDIVPYDPLNIIIKDQERLSLTNVCKYDSVTILPGGELIIDTNIEQLTFHSDTLIVTRDMVMSKYDFDSMFYGNVFMACNDAKLVITDY